MATAPHNFTKEELELLSDEEREGLLEDIDNEGDEEGEDEDGDVVEPGDTGTVDTSGIGTDPLKEAAENADGKTIDADTVVPEKKPDAELPAAAKTEAPAAPAFPKFEAPADAKEQLTALDSQLDALAAKFDDGELSAAEYRAQSKPLEQQQRALERQVERAELSRDVSVETWTNTIVPSFFAKHTQYEPGSTLYNSLDQEVRKIQSESENQFDPTILERAHKAVTAAARKALGLPEEEPGKDNPKPKTVQRRDIPPSLANVPAADITETQDNGEFAYLDRLQEKDGLAFEKALAKLTDEQRDRYLASA